MKKEIELNKVHLGDSLEIMKQMDSDIIDLTVTSPPYDNLRSYKESLDDWNIEKFKNIARELYRITKAGGVVVWVVGDATIKGSESGSSFRQALFFIECGFNLHDTMIWRKDTLSFPASNRYGQCFEYMFVLSKGKPKTFNPIKDRKNKWFGHKIHGTNRLKDGTVERKSNHNKNVVSEFGSRFNVWDISTEKNNKTGHPAVFPESIAQDHILSWSNAGDIVLDPFLGSGTTAMVAAVNGRNYIGIERVLEYYEIAVERIK